VAAPTVKDPVAGSGIEFIDKRTKTLAGVSGNAIVCGEGMNRLFSNRQFLIFVQQILPTLTWIFCSVLLPPALVALTVMMCKAWPHDPPISFTEKTAPVPI
jgi:hypothetical protein